VEADASDEVIDSKIVAGLKNVTLIFAITGETYKLLFGLLSNARFHIQIQDTYFTKQRSIDTMTPNELIVYVVAGMDLVFADMVVADMIAPHKTDDAH